MNKKYCLDCKKEISSRARRCKSCSHKGSFNINFGGLSENHCKNISKTCKGRPSAFKGKKHTKESKEKNRQKHLGRKIPSITGDKNPAKRLEVRAKMRKAAKGKILTEDWKRKIRESCQGINEGRDNGMFGRTPEYERIKYKDIWMRSSYEIKFVYFLDLSGYKWKYEPKRFNLGNTTYTPDFYIPEWDLYIEIKGYWRNKNKIKFLIFKKLYPKIRIKVLKQKALKRMGVLI